MCSIIIVRRLNQMDFKIASNYFKERIHELSRVCADGTPWVFLSASAFLEYLSKLVNGEDKKHYGYKKFVEDYLSQVRPLYKDFVYKNGAQDLSIQMYHVLRCGIVHSFSLIPDAVARRAGGRDRSIVLCHAKERDEQRWTHLMRYSSPKVADAALFVAEDFVNDIGKVTDLIFQKAANDGILRGNIEKYSLAHPPIIGGF